MVDDDVRDRQRELGDLRWEIHNLSTRKAALEERLAQAIPSAVPRLQEQIGECAKDLLLATARLNYLDKLEAAENKPDLDEENLLKPRKPKLKR
ncbi:hypothetical protein [Bradyrhizobium cenepequi]